MSEQKRQKKTIHEDITMNDKCRRCGTMSAVTHECNPDPAIKQTCMDCNDNQKCTHPGFAGDCPVNKERREGTQLKHCISDNEFHILNKPTIEQSYQAACMWCGYEMERIDKKEFMAAVCNHLLDCKEHPLVRRITELVEQLKHKDEELAKLKKTIAEMQR